MSPTTMPLHDESTDEVPAPGPMAMPSPPAPLPSAAVKKLEMDTLGLVSAILGHAMPPMVDPKLYADVSWKGPIPAELGTVALALVNVMARSGIQPWASRAATITEQSLSTPGGLQMLATLLEMAAKDPKVVGALRPVLQGLVEKHGPKPPPPVATKKAAGPPDILRKAAPSTPPVPSAPPPPPVGGV